jgi:cell wall-associated NlpC family hydrolase
MRSRLVPLLAALACAWAGAARADAGDPIERWLNERGLAAAASPTAAARDRMAELVVAAMNFVDVPYRLGGTDAEGFDCSGFTRHLFQLNLGLALPRRSHEQATAQGLASVARDALQPGDLVFFNTLKRAFSHVGIYVGDGRFIHSPRSGAAVRLESMASAYWARRFDGARRVASASASPEATVAAVAARPRVQSLATEASH